MPKTVELGAKYRLYIKKFHYEGARTNWQRPSYFNWIYPKSVQFSLNVSEEYPYNDAKHSSFLNEVELETDRKTSWLYTDARYQHIRQLALNDKIALITESICAHSVFEKISKLLQDNMLQIDTVYVSNIAERMYTESDQQDFLNTVTALLPDTETILIDARFAEEGSPAQRCISKKSLNRHTAKDWFFSKPNSNVENDNPVSALSPKA